MDALIFVHKYFTLAINFQLENQNAARGS